MNFTVAAAGPPATLTSVSPNVGSVQGGQQTILTGMNFVSWTTVKIGNKPASVITLVSAMTMIVQVPASVPGPTDVAVTNPNGDVVLQNGYIYLSGVPLDGPFTGSFTTGSGSDTVSLTVMITPVNGANNLPFNTSIVLTFSEPINPNTVNAATGIRARTTTTATFSESVNPNAITPSTFQVTSGGTPIAWAYSSSNLNQTTCWTCPTQLQIWDC